MGSCYGLTDLLLMLPQPLDLELLLVLVCFLLCLLLGKFDLELEHLLLLSLLAQDAL